MLRDSASTDFNKIVLTDEVIDLMVRETYRNAEQTVTGRRLSRSSRLR